MRCSYQIHSNKRNAKPAQLKFDKSRAPSNATLLIHEPQPSRIRTQQQATQKNKPTS